jgi:AraC-like DNA-binding protein
MMCIRCIIKVQEELSKLYIAYEEVNLGYADLPEKLSPALYQQLKANLLTCGLELIEDKKQMIIEQVKNVIIHMIYHAEEFPAINYSDYISSKIGYDYTYLANLFTLSTGISIQQFIILHKIIRTKELIFYGELSLSQIAYRLDYSDQAHLSRQFKKVTGFSPSQFRLLMQKRNSGAENV